MQTHKLTVAASLLCALFISNTHAAENTNLHDLIKQQQKRLEVLESQVEATASQVESNHHQLSGVQLKRLLSAVMVSCTTII